MRGLEMRLIKDRARIWTCFLTIVLTLCANVTDARNITFAWDASPDWPSGTTIQLEANGASANGITTTQHILDVPVQSGEVITVRARAIPPSGYECCLGDIISDGGNPPVYSCSIPLEICPPSTWSESLVQTVPPNPSGLWAAKEPVGEGGIMAAPTFIAQYATAFNSDGSSKTAMSAVSINSDDVIVLVSASENYLGLTSETENGAGSFTNQEVFNTSNYCYTRASTYIAPANETITINVTKTGAIAYFGGNAVRFSGSSGIGATEINNGASGTPSVSITTTQANSAIVVIASDWNASTGSQTFTSSGGAGSPSDLTGFPGDNSHYGVAVAYYADAGSAGSKTVGMSAPTNQKWAIIAIEVKGTAGGAVTVSPNDMQHAQSMDAATLLQAHILAVSELLHSQALDNATITQAFTLTPSDAINTQAIDPTTLLQQSFISPSELQQINSMDTTTLIQAHTLAITDLLHSQAFDNATITQASTLTPNDALNYQLLDATTLLQQSVISPADLLQGNTLDATTLIQAHMLAIADITHAQTIDNVSLVVAGDISPDEMMTLQAMDAPLLLQAHIIAPNDALNAQSIDSPVIVQSNVLIPAGMDHAVILDSPVIVQANVISPSELLTAQAVDNVTLAVLGSLSVDDLLSSQAIESPGLTQAHTIAPNELTHVNSIDASELFQGFILVPADLLHEQVMEGALLDVIFGLSPADLLNAQGIESPGLIQAHVIFPADLLQANRFDVAGISSGLLQVPTGRAIVLGRIGSICFIDACR
jgi:hypothetical protein